MENYEYKRMISRMNEIQPSDKAVVLLIMDCGGDVSIATAGEPDAIQGCVKYLKKEEK